MAPWRYEEVDAARHPEEKIEATRLGKLLSHTETILRSGTHWPSRRLEVILVRTETCVAPGHADALRDFMLCSPNEQHAGGWGCAARLSLLLYFSCSADHGRDSHRVK